MAIENVMLVGNRDLSYTIIGALASAQDSRHYRLSVLTHPLQTPHLPSHVTPTHVKHVTTDFSPDSLQSAFTGQGLIISTIAGGDYDFQTRIIDAAVNVGVKRFIAHEFGYDTLNERVRERVIGGTQRARVIEYLQNESEKMGIEWAAAATGCTLDSVLVSGELGIDLQWRSATIHGSGQEIFPASSLERVGVVVQRMIEHWEEVKNQYLYAPGVFTTANDILACLESATASEWSVGRSEVEDAVREGSSRIERGFPDSGMALLQRSVLYDSRLQLAETFQKENTNRILQLCREDVAAIVSKALHEFDHRSKSNCGCS